MFGIIDKIGEIRTGRLCDEACQGRGVGNHAKGVTAVYGRGVLGYDDPFVWTDCITSIASSLYGRFITCLNTSYDMVRVLHPVWDLANTIIPSRPAEIIPWTYEQVVQSFTGSKRRLYERALKYPGLIDPMVKVFDKIESYSWRAAKDKPPRPISPRSIQFRLELARYIKPIEKWIKTYKLPGCHFPFYAKGAGPRKLAKRFIRMGERFKRPHFYSFDMKRFDGHVNFFLLSFEIAFLVAIMPLVALRNLLQQCLRNTYKKRNLKAFTLGGRCSGDIHTGLGNTILMSMMCWVVGTYLGVLFEIFSNGDDTVLVTDREIDVDHAIRLFGYFGMEAKLESVSRTPFEVDWCRSRIVELDDGPTWCRDPRRVMQTLFSNKHYGNRKWRGLQKAIAQCELAVNLGCPLIDPLCRRMIEQDVRAWKITADFDPSLYYRKKIADGIDVSKRMISLTAYERYGRTFSLSVQDIRRLEQVDISDSPLSSAVWGSFHPQGVGESQF